MKKVTNDVDRTKLQIDASEMSAMYGAIVLNKRQYCYSINLSCRGDLYQFPARLQVAEFDFTAYLKANNTRNLARIAGVEESNIKRS